MDNPSIPMAQLKKLLHRGYPHGKWDFSALLASVFPKISQARIALYSALGSTLLDSSSASKLDEFEKWRALG